jgi:hypothetical protein
MALPVNRNQNPADRVKKAVAGNINEAHSCEKCGGTFFVQNSAYQQSVTSYGVRIASVSPQMYHSCVGCGEPLIPSNLQNMANKGGEREAFLESVALGKKYREKLDPTNLAKNSASIHELEALKSEVDQINEVLANLLELIDALENKSTEESISLEVNNDEANPPVIEKTTRRNKAKGDDK